MRRDQLEHLIRAAGSLLGDDTVIVIGSQAILATVPAPAEEALMRSMETMEAATSALVLGSAAR